MPALLFALAAGTRDPLERIWRVTAALSGAFVVVLAVLLVIGHLQAPVHDPLKAAALIAAKESLHAAPKDETLKQQLRELDLETRAGFFLRLARNQWGGWLLLGGFALFILAAKQAAGMRVRPPNPQASTGQAAVTRERMGLSVSVAVSGGLALAALVVAALAGTSALPPTAVSDPAAVQAQGASSLPGAAEYNANWPRFRGPDGGGVSACTHTPVAFDSESGANVVWKSAVPLAGFSSPVVWGDRVFLTGSDGRQRELLCFDARTGAVLWRLPVALVPETAVVAMNISDSTGLAAGTPATDGERVYAFFATGELIAADFMGKLVWSKNLGKPDNLYGHAASLTTWRDRVLFQFDQGGVKAGKSKVIAFDGKTGKVIWEQKRPVGAAWTTPFVALVGGREQFITESEPWVIAYAPEDGKELWRFGGVGTDLVSSPISASGLVFVVDASNRLLAIKPDGHGDVTPSHLAWSSTEFLPDIASPVSTGDLLFTLQSGGVLACLEASTGKKVWEHTYEGNFQASPTIAGGRLYLFSKEGDAIVVEVARQFKELGRGKLGEALTASPAIVRDRLYVRGEKHLFCLGAAAGKEVVNAR